MDVLVKIEDESGKRWQGYIDYDLSIYVGDNIALEVWNGDCFTIIRGTVIEIENA